MTRDDIIRMAREAGYGLSLSDMHGPALERFAALVAAAEREACVAACEARAKAWGEHGITDRTLEAQWCANEIRARGDRVPDA